MDSRIRVADLLASLFSHGELRAFLLTHDHDEVVHSMTWSDSRSSLSLEVASALKRRGLLDRAFFDALAAQRVHRAAEIQELAHQLGIAQAPAATRPAPPAAMAPGIRAPGTHDPGTRDPGTRDPGTRDPGTRDPGPTPARPTPARPARSRGQLLDALKDMSESHLEELIFRLRVPTAHLTSTTQVQRAIMLIRLIESQGRTAQLDAAIDAVLAG